MYDRTVYVDLGKYGAHFAHTLTDEKGDISKSDWDKLRIGMFCMNSQAETDVETAIDQFCTAYNVCDYVTRESLRSGFLRMRGLKKYHHKMVEQGLL